MSYAANRLPSSSVRPVVGAKEWRREETASSAAPGASAAAPSSSGPPKIPGVQPGGWRSRAAQAESSGAVSPAAVASPPDSRSGTPASGERKPLGLQPRTGGAAPSWRDREASRSAAPNDAPPPAARPPPAPRPQEQTNGAEEGFKTVAPKKPAGGAYVPPSVSLSLIADEIVEQQTDPAFFHSVVSRAEILSDGAWQNLAVMIPLNVIFQS